MTPTQERLYADADVREWLHGIQERDRLKYQIKVMALENNVLYIVCCVLFLGLLAVGGKLLAQ